ncbi:hypothetical protein ElyMa_000379000 [Elysia marginata]|uniref:Uncharacterized protein n=1 Tax=Elysia marginata TaxID=1093978 RepID=A0AAV4FJC3_9GAST|nr:hypothetical protein ElyMa_000379000 [Elysia marginata]
MCTSYKKILSLSEDIASAMKTHFQNEGIFCPHSLKKDTYTIGAVDNIDYNPTSTTSKKSFHGTGISIFQSIVEEEEPFIAEFESSRVDTVLQDFFAADTVVAFFSKKP